VFSRANLFKNELHNGTEEFSSSLSNIPPKDVSKAQNHGAVVECTGRQNVSSQRAANGLDALLLKESSRACSIVRVRPRPKSGTFLHLGFVRVDTIRIYQEDRVEKGQQIKPRPEIYGTAAQVLVWPGKLVKVKMTSCNI
jgi:hypothetical protein